MSVDVFLSVLDRYGVSVALVFATAYAVYRIGVWFGQNIVPVFLGRLFKHLDVIDENISENTRALVGMAKDVENIKDAINGHGRNGRA